MGMGDKERVISRTFVEVLEEEVRTLKARVKAYEDYIYNQ